jgi:hypothetical protein
MRSLVRDDIEFDFPIQISNISSVIASEARQSTTPARRAIWIASSLRSSQ